ncbi:hypothetical protein Bca101_010936 [Brassica carinata]
MVTFLKVFLRFDGVSFFWFCLSLFSPLICMCLLLASCGGFAVGGKMCLSLSSLATGQIWSSVHCPIPD